MALIRATHLECGDVDITSKDVRVYTYQGDAENPAGWYRFTCIACGKIALYDADPNAFNSFRKAGCSIEAVDPPKHDYREIDTITHQQGVLSVDEVLDTVGALAKTTDHDIMEILTHSLE